MDGLVEVDVVVKAVLDGWAVDELCVGPDVADCLGHNVGAAMAHNVEGLRVFNGDDSEVDVVIERGGQVGEFSVYLCGYGLFCQIRAYFFSQLAGGRAVIEFYCATIGQFDFCHIRSGENNPFCQLGVRFLRLFRNITFRLGLSRLIWV